MGNFNRDDRRGGGRSFDRPRRDFGNDRGRPQDRQMHQAVCDSCGKNCEVPFKPNGSRPIYCSDCFEKNGGGARKSGGDDRGGRRQSFGNRNDRPNRGSDQPQSNARFDELNAKLDKILGLLSSAPTAQASNPEPQNEEVITEDAAPVKKKKVKKPVVAKEVEVPLQEESPVESPKE